MDEDNLDQQIEAEGEGAIHAEDTKQDDAEADQFQDDDEDFSKGDFEAVSYHINSYPYWQHVLFIDK